MKTVSVLVPEHSVLQAIADPQYCFEVVNHFMVLSGKIPLFKVELVGMGKKVALSAGRYEVHTDKVLHKVQHTDLVIVPALFGDFKTAIEANRPMIPWIVDQYKRGAEVASLCVGAFLLASTGLLNGKKCSTHWGFYNEFKAMFPAVDVQDGGIVTEENGIYSSGGANSYWNLLIHLVEKFTNRETAVLTAKYFAIDIDRASQAAFSMFKGQKAHKDDVIKQAQEYIEGSVDEKITIDGLANRLALGRRSLERRFKAATNNTVLEYVQRVKIEAAKRQLETSRRNIIEVMFDVGYNDLKTFRNIFKKITGLTPQEYKNKYNKLQASSTVGALNNNHAGF